MNMNSIDTVAEVISPSFFTAFVEVFIEMAPYLAFGLLVAGVLHIFVRKSFIIKHLGTHGFMSTVKASLLGVPLPLCSCSVVPTALSLRKSGASQGATLSFLISTPQTGVESIAATWGMMGPVFAIFRPVAAFITGVVGGSIASATAPQIEDEEIALEEEVVVSLSLGEKFKELFRYGFVELMDDLAFNLLIGIMISAVITSLIPESYKEQLIAILGDKVLLQMLIVMVIAVPMYICATASIPIALSLTALGFSPAAAFVFLITGPATNAATITVIAGKLGKRIAVIYLATIVILAIPFGFLLQYIYHYLGIDMGSAMGHMHGEHGTPWWKLVSALFFAFFMLGSLWRVYGKPLVRKFKKRDGGVSMTSENKIFTVSGMTCKNCVRHVVETAEAVKNAENVEVSLEAGTLVMSGDIDSAVVIEQLAKAGYATTQITQSSSAEFDVAAMTCKNCVRHVVETAEKTVGVGNVEVDLESGTMVISSGITEEQRIVIIESVTKAGYLTSLKETV